MTTITDKELIKEIKERIGSLDVRDNIERRAYEIALASLEAEPIAWECGENIILFNPNTVEAYAKRAEISPKPLFSAPPALVVPDKLRVNTETVGLLRIVIMLKAGTTAAKPCFREINHD
ncbi:Valyl-tRNA synthetase [Escherichia coli]|nr:Valyl-tRNA synthetase [Escherichia coli]